MQQKAWMFLACAIVAGCALPHAELRGGDGGGADQSTDTLVDAADRVIPSDVADAADAADAADVVDAADVTDVVAMDADAASEAGMDAEAGADAEAGMDAADTGADVREAGADAMDTGVDARDAAPDAMDSGADARPDSAPDAMPDSAPDAMPDSAPDAMPDSAPDAPVRYRLGPAVPLAWVPSTPGSGTSQALCQANSIMVGASAHKYGIAPTVLNGVRLTCATLNSNGTLGATSNTSQLGDAFGTERTPACAAGEVAVANTVRAGDFVDEVSFDCVSLTRLLPPSPTETVASTQIFTGETGGTPTATRCPVGSVVVGVTITQASCGALCGDRVNRFRFTCAPIETY